MQPLGRKPPRAPQLEETPETPPSSRAEGLLFLHGLESNPGSSLHTQEGYEKGNLALSGPCLSPYYLPHICWWRGFPGIRQRKGLSTCSSVTHMFAKQGHQGITLNCPDS